MKQSIKIEFHKLIYTKRLWICLIIGCGICVLNILYFYSSWQWNQENWQILEEYYEDTVINPEIPMFTLYNSWINNEGYTFSFSIFFFLFPLLCVTPYGWSLCEDIQEGYLKNIAARMKRKEYFIAKAVCTFFSGGITMVIPLIFNFMINAMFIPAVKPDLSYPAYMMTQPSFISDMYCEYPFLFNLIYLGMAFIYCGLLALMSFACCYIVKNKIFTILIPFGLLLLGHYLSTIFCEKYDASPLYCIHATPVRYANSWIVLAAYMGGMLAIFLLVMCRKGTGSYEIY